MYSISVSQSVVAASAVAILGFLLLPHDHNQLPMCDSLKPIYTLTATKIQLDTFIFHQLHMVLLELPLNTFTWHLIISTLYNMLDIMLSVFSSLFHQPYIVQSHHQDQVLCSPQTINDLLHLHLKTQYSSRTELCLFLSPE